jgi:mannose-1-phosphate guanylyltransferase
MFIWTVHAIVGAFNRHAAELGEFIGRIHGGADLPKLLEEVFPKLPKISIDYAILEKAARVLVVESAFDWDDVGGWTAVAKYLARDAHGNQGNCTVKTIDSANNIIFSKSARTIALLGVSDLIVVETPDAILVCQRHEAEKIKQLVAMVPPELQ